MDIKRVFDIITYAEKNYGKDHQIFGYKRDNQWNTMSVEQYKVACKNISKALMELGAKRNDKIALISSSRPEWNIVDMAILQFGGISIPIYPTISETEYKYIFEHSEINFVVVENNFLLGKIKGIIPQSDKNINILTIDKTSEEYKSFDDLITLGAGSTKDSELDEAMANTNEEDLATLIYTSGTTGKPKGAMLTHSNFVYQLKNLKQIPDKNNKRSLSFLPLCHVYERMLVYLYQYIGITTYYAESLATITDDLKYVNPNMMTCVPRMLEKIYEKLISAGEKQKGFSKKIYFWAVNVAKQHDWDNLSLYYKTKRAIADKLVYSKWREALGGDFDIVVSGGSSINPALTSFFNAMGWPIFEGYGMSETSPVIAVSEKWPHGKKAGSVGPALPGVEIKIDKKTNEICCKGHNVMKGYYKDPEQTTLAIDDEGWFHTGDCGKFDQYNRLYITGRLKTIFKTSFGKYINPEAIETKCCESKFIDQMMVVGENEKFAAALVVPNFDAIREFDEKAKNESNKTLASDNNVNKKIMDEIKSFNSSFGSWEQIKKIKLISDDWSQASGLITPTLKLKRNVVKERYAKEIKELFT